MSGNYQLWRSTLPSWTTELSMFDASDLHHGSVYWDVMLLYDANSYGSGSTIDVGWWILIRRELPHPARCPTCHQANDIIQCPMVSCLVAREVWFILLWSPNDWPPGVSPQADPAIFTSWYCRALKSVDKQFREKAQLPGNPCHMGPWTQWSRQRQGQTSLDSRALSWMTNFFAGNLTMYCMH